MYVGPEVVSQATKVLEVVAAAIADVDLQLETHDFGGGAIDKYGEPLPESTLKACQEADAILMGSFQACSKSELFSDLFIIIRCDRRTKVGSQR